jgi:hypothetical protein
MLIERLLWNRAALNTMFLLELPIMVSINAVVLLSFASAGRVVIRACPPTAREYEIILYWSVDDYAFIEKFLNCPGARPMVRLDGECPSRKDARCSPNTIFGQAENPLPTICKLYFLFPQLFNTLRPP